MKNNTVIVSSVITLVIGLVIGYAVWGNKTMDMDMNMGMSPKTGSQTGGHMMPDGTMMGGSMTMSGMMEDMMANLKGKTGDAFDKAFIEEMVMHHEGAVVMAESALQNGKNQEIKDLAKAIISAQNTEISQMRAWYKAWYGMDLKN